MKFKSIGCCFVFLLCIFGFISIAYLISNGSGSPFYELGDDYARYPEEHTIIKIVTRFADGQHTFKHLIPGPGDVVEGSYDNNYIIAHQRYDEFYSTIVPAFNSIINEHNGDSIVTDIEFLRKMKDCYWIIYKKKDIVAGPFNKHDFEVRCKKEGINLKFEKW